MSYLQKQHQLNADPMISHSPLKRNRLFTEELNTKLSTMFSPRTGVKTENPPPNNIGSSSSVVAPPERKNKNITKVRKPPRKQTQQPGRIKIVNTKKGTLKRTNSEEKNQQRRGSDSKKVVKRTVDKDIYNFNFLKLLEIEYDVNEFDPYKFIARLPNIKPHTKYCIPTKSHNSPKITLVLDLDETLVHCATFGMKSYDLIFPVLFGGTEYKVYVKLRPYYREFLEFCSKYFEVIVFTASHKTYANKLLDLVDKKRKWIIYRAFRESCVQVEGNYLKDLTVLGRNLATTCIIDNSPTAFGFQIPNGIPISSWYEDSNDRELMNIIPFLKRLAKCNDVRPLITQKFKFHEVINQYKKNM